MFTKLFTLSTLVILAIATPTPDDTGDGSAGSCSTGPLQCCQSVQAANSKAATTLLGSIGVVVQDVTTPIGITCSPIFVVNVGGSDACSANAVCCENNSFGGLIAIGCLPVSV